MFHTAPADTRRLHVADQFDAAAEFDDDFDPTGVPVFPRLAIEVSRVDPATEAANPYRALLEGQPVDVGHPPGFGSDAPITDEEWLSHTMVTARTAAADLIRRRDYGPCRVNAIDVDGVSWPLIIGPNGETYDLKQSDDHRTAKSSRKRRRTASPAAVWLAVAAVIMAVVIVGCLTAVVVVRHQRAVAAAEAAQRRAPKPKPVPAEYPILAPAGSTTHARWQYGPTADQSQADKAAAIAPDGSLWVRTDGELVRLDARVGRPAWQTKIADDATGPWIRPATTNSGDQVTVLVTQEGQKVTWRNLTDRQPQTASFDAASTLLPLAGGIVLQEPDQRTAILTNHGPVNRLIPAGSRIVGVEDTTLYTAAGDQLWALDTDQRQTPDPVTLQPPAKGTTVSDDSLIWKDGALASVWASGDPSKPSYVAFHDTAGKLIAADKIAGDSGAGTPDDLNDPRYTIYGRHLVDHQDHSTMELPANWVETEAITADHIFGTDGSSQSIRYALTTHKARTTTLGDQAGGAIIGEIGGDAVATAGLSDGTHIYRLQPLR